MAEYLVITKNGGGGWQGIPIIPEGFERLGWEKFAAKLYRADALFFSSHGHGSQG